MNESDVAARVVSYALFPECILLDQLMGKDVNPRFQGLMCIEDKV